MPLVEIDLTIDISELPGEVRAFLDEADQRVEAFVRDSSVRIPGFVPCDFVTAYRALLAVSESRLAAGHAFCEWGSGFGVVTCLASMLEFDACGIEIDRALVDASESLANDSELSVQFGHGSFIPEGGDAYADEIYSSTNAEVSWLVTDAPDAYDEIGLDADDFDVVFSYPWPGESGVIDHLFDRFAADGALLLTYHQFDTVRLQRKVRGRRS